MTITVSAETIREGSGIDFSEFSRATVYTSRHFWMAVCNTYSKGPRSSFERFSGFVEGVISRFARPTWLRQRLDPNRTGIFTEERICFLLGLADASITRFPRN